VNYSKAVRPQLLIAAILLSSFIATAQVQVLTQHNDIARTGQNLNETILTTSNVSVANFGKLFTLPVDGLIYAQPLYLPNLTINGGTHNVVFVATLNNSVYAVDGDTGASLWQVSLGPSVPAIDICTPFQTGCNTTGRPYPDLTSDIIGIVSTPVIDPSTNTLYVVAYNKDSASNYNFRLHALDVTSGGEKFGGPAVLTTPGFTPLSQLQRPGLLLLHGTVYIAFGSKGDFDSWHGYVMGYDSQTLQQNAVFNTTPETGGNGSGIWQGGMGLVADSSNNIYFATSNGDFDKPNGANFGSSFIQLSTPSLSATDYYAPNTQSFLNLQNGDLGSGGPLLLPDGALVGGGKDGILHVMDIAPGKMGGFDSLNDQNVQNLQANNVYPNGMIMGGPVFWNNPAFGMGAIYLWGPGDVPKAWGYNGKTNGGNAITTVPASQGTIGNAAGNSNEAAMSISTNGTTPGTAIFWATAPRSGDANEDVQPGAVYAFDATDLAKELWDSTQNLSRDDLGLWGKFTSPTIANGKVYVASFTPQLVAYGLLVQPAKDFTLASSTLSPSSGSAGSTATANITVTAVNGFNSAVALACSITPVVTTAPPTCSLSPASVTPGANPATSTLTITTTAAKAASLSPRQSPAAPLYAVWLPIPAMALAGLGLGARRRKLCTGLLCVMMITLILLLAGCGGGSTTSGGGGGGGGTSGTPPGTYTVTVTGTQGALSHQVSSSLTFTVQ